MARWNLLWKGGIMLVTYNNKIECSCGAILDYTEKDVQSYIDMPPMISFKPIRTYYVECPICHRKHIINKEEL